MTRYGLHWETDWPAMTRVVLAGGGPTAHQWLAYLTTALDHRITGLVNLPGAPLGTAADTWSVTAPTYPDLAHALADSPDLVVNLAPLPDRAAVTLAALAAGAHVVCEQPFAATAGDAAAILDLAAEHGLRVATAARRATDPGLTVITQTLEALGPGPHRPYRMTCDVLLPNLGAAGNQNPVVLAATVVMDLFTRLGHYSISTIGCQQVPVTIDGQVHTIATGTITTHLGASVTYRTGYLPPATPGLTGPAGTWRIDGVGGHLDWANDQVTVTLPEGRLPPLSARVAADTQHTWLHQVIADIHGTGTGLHSATTNTHPVAFLHTANAAQRRSRPQPMRPISTANRPTATAATEGP